MKSKILSIVISCLIVAGCSGEKRKVMEPHPLVSAIEVVKMNFRSFVIVKVGCGMLEELMDSEVEDYFISEKDRISAVLNSIEKSDPNEEHQEPDTRARLRISYRDGHVDSLCVGKFWASFNGQPIILEDSLRDFLENLEYD